MTFNRAIFRDVQTIDRINAEDEQGNRRVRIIWFSTIFAGPVDSGNVYRYATLMRSRCGMVVHLWG